MMKAFWGFIVMMILLTLIGCQSSTNPSMPDVQTERQIPAQYRNLDVPIIKTVP